VKQVVLYGAPDCHLCEHAEAKLERVRRLVPFEYRYENIRQDAALTDRYGTLIPVVTVNGKEAAVTKVTEFRLLKALALS
jgi:hypothetical protein